MVGIRKKLFRELEIPAGHDKKEERKKERMFGRVEKIPIANTFSALVEMGFGGYGDYAAFLHIRSTLSRFSLAVFAGGKKKGGETAEIHRGRRFRIG